MFLETHAIFTELKCIVFHFREKSDKNGLQAPRDLISHIIILPVDVSFAQDGFQTVIELKERHELLVENGRRAVITCCTDHALNTEGEHREE